MASVKTAISMEQGLFRKAEELARRLRLSPSQLFARAVREHIRRHEGREILDNLNDVYADEPHEGDRQFLQSAGGAFAELTEGRW